MPGKRKPRAHRHRELNGKSHPALKKKCPPRYSHSIQTIQTLITLKLHTSASFRALAQSSVILQDLLEVPLQSATHTTILWWVKKLGYYTLTTPKPVANDWIILLDESVQLGPGKLLVIWGIRASMVDIHRPLRYQDLEPLWISASAHWNGPFIRDILEQLDGSLGHIVYAVGDYGSDLKKGLRLAGIPHIHDVTHRIALLLKALYADDPAYQDIAQRLAQIRRQFRQTTASHLLPPAQRSKSRYHNLQPLAAYGRHILTYLASPPASEHDEQPFRDAIAWMLPYHAFFEELHEVTALVEIVERQVKHNGLSPETIAHCCQALPPITTEKGRCFMFDILVYMHTMLTRTTAKQAIVCTSDILESAFGKYKNYVSRNPMAGITDLALCLAAFTSTLSSQEIVDALEHTTCHAVTRWAHIYLGTTLLKKRREVFSKSPK
jgi:hypothetical protein